ncbi:hypothetical protein B0J12DRAFT_340013 [Macrophomina phaseolina]|uniref:Sel1-like protein n=1 Tax=Macrophomina phaseolina TaxID=35725 RepID=A0ABQ8GLU5_9PEZI|nr:hypothetical protein B0J12DRAFT_340013 [Macrophomina phaseolina]
MASNPPNDLDLRPGSQESNRSRATNFLGDLPSPRTGEVPPALSPLDAFAMQSRLLAKRFEEQKNGRRISRLPPLTIQNEFGKQRQQGYFRSRSAERERGDGRSPEEDRTPHSAKEVTPVNRPMSQHPTISDDFGGPISQYDPKLSPLGEEDHTPPTAHAPQDYFAIPRAASPEPMDPPVETRVEEATPNTPGTRYGPAQSIPATRPQRTGTMESSISTRSDMRGLMPLRSPGPARSPRIMSPSIRSVRNDSADEVEHMSLGGSFDSLPPRQLSSNTSYSRSHSPASPYPPSVPRSPSISSECSYNSQRLAKPAFNFSRPRPSLDARPSTSDLRPSLDSRPSFERARTPSRQASGEGSQRAPSRQEYDGPQLPSYAHEQVHTPVSMASDDYMNASADGPAPSYIYAKYALPRGRTLDRESMCTHDFLNQQVRWEDGAPPGSRNGERPPSPPSPPKTANSEKYHDKPKSFDIPRASSPSAVSSNSTIKPHQSRPSSSGAATSITATSRIADMTPEMHLERGIEFHEKGEVQKATYHWRLAAKAEIPTAMLLYALACRHGWGMRPNPAEGVKWLRKAVDAAQLEVADDEDLVTKGKPGPDVVERRTHKAQFAVSVYELGVSYMNGWGIQQDKGLALRCFEIAGNWGDGDALAEAGFCYHEGIGCKKDLKKSAKFYRMAEAKGVSVAGNSWIHKDKYKDDDADDDRRGRSTKKESDKKARDKSRTRALFSRKKSVA